MIEYIYEEIVDSDGVTCYIKHGEVVRCKDCTHYEFADNRAFGMPVKYCDWFGFEDVDDNDFCSRGERKGGDSE